jgi:hypothetical protein
MGGLMQVEVGDIISSKDGKFYLEVLSLNEENIITYVYVKAELGLLGYKSSSNLDNFRHFIKLTPLMKELI